MKKASLSLLSIVLLMVSCQKNISSLPPAEEPTATEILGRKCGSMEILDEQLRTDPERAKNLEDLERKTREFAGRSYDQRTAGVKLYIPVVVNVVLSDANKVTTAQIQSQLDALNKDYNRNNAELTNSAVYLAGYSYSNVANCQIEFYIQDWNNDVNRRSGAGSFSTNDAVKKTASGGLNPESPTTKLNLWVCDLGSGLLGYAQFPGGNSAVDGVVIDYQAFGTTASYTLYSTYNKGRTATHEIGHWLNLRHIWGDSRCGNDQVDDTPLHTDANYGCPAQGLQSKCTGKPLMQWMNYMDYTDDVCMYMFTTGQKTRMDAVLDASRKAYTRTAK